MVLCLFLNYDILIILNNFKFSHEFLVISFLHWNQTVSFYSIWHRSNIFFLNFGLKWKGNNKDTFERVLATLTPHSTFSLNLNSGELEEACSHKNFVFILFIIVCIKVMNSHSNSCQGCLFFFPCLFFSYASGSSTPSTLPPPHHHLTTFTDFLLYFRQCSRYFSCMISFNTVTLEVKYRYIP